MAMGSIPRGIRAGRGVDDRGRDDGNVYYYSGGDRQAPELERRIRRSYDLVVAKLPKKAQAQLRSGA
jgi:hypothetical protein